MFAHSVFNDPPTSFAEPRAVSALRSTSRIASALVAALGGLILADWIWRLGAIRSWAPGHVIMKPGASFAFILAGVSLGLLSGEGRGVRLAARFCALAVALIGLLSLSQDLFGWNIGMDQLLVGAEPGAVGTARPGPRRVWMASGAAFNFLLIGLSLALLDARGKLGLRTAQLLALLVAAISLMEMVGHLFNFIRFSHSDSLVGMAISTSLTFIILCLGVLFARPERGLMAFVTSSSAGALMTRRMLLAAFSIPLALGGLALAGEREGFFDEPGSISLMAVTTVIVFVTLIWQSARTLRQVDSERRLTMETLRRSEARLAKAQEMASLGYWERDLVNDELNWSDEVYRIFGLAPQTVVTIETFFDRVHPDDVEMVKHAIASAERKGRSYHLDHHIVRPSGVVRIVHEEVEFICNGEGHPVRLVGTVQDVTGLKRAEEALRESEERYRAFITNSSEGIWRFEGRPPLDTSLPVEEQIDLLFEHCYLAECNDAMARMYGYERAEEIVGARLEDLLPRSNPLNIEFLRAFIEAGYKLSDAESYEFDQAGRPKCFSNSLTGIVKDGKVLRAWGTQRDITERKQAEEELRESAVRQRLALEAAEMDAWEFDPGSGQITLGRRIAELFGVAPGARQVEFAEWTERIHPDDFARIREAFARAVRGAADYDAEYRVLQPDGSVRWVMSKGVLASDEAGRARRFYGVAADITARKLAEQEREELLAREQKARAEAETANRMKDEFLATVSHELRTPLSSILGWAQLLRAGKLDEAAAARAMEVIERSAQSQARLIEDILDVSRIITGKLKLNAQPIDIAAMLRSAIEVVRPGAEAKDITLSAVIDFQEGVVHADANRLQQAIWDLLSNAVKFTPRRGRIEARLERVGSQVEIAISDTGQGIPQKFLPHVFERFRQADGSTARQHGGLGLGLAIVRHIVEMHGGAVSAESAGPGHGATFKIRLPLAASRIQAPAPEASRQDKTPATSPSFTVDRTLEGVRALVVDDNVDSLEVISRFLTLHRADVATAASADEALATLARYRPNVLICDIAMPGKDGYELIREVRS
ncbi:MAG: hybrid sensor histidine kinase/response regulator, partial [Blastocatellia bacterium]